MSDWVTWHPSHFRVDLKHFNLKNSERIKPYFSHTNLLSRALILVSLKTAHVKIGAAVKFKG